MPPWVLVILGFAWVGGLLVVLDTDGLWSDVLLGGNLVVLVAIVVGSVQLGRRITHQS